MAANYLKFQIVLFGVCALLSYMNDLLIITKNKLLKVLKLNIGGKNKTLKRHFLKFLMEVII